MPRAYERRHHVISAYRDALNREGHELIDELRDYYHEWQIRRAVSEHVGIPWEEYNTKSGFHFSSHHPIDQVERAVSFLRAAARTSTLPAPRQTRTYPNPAPMTLVAPKLPNRTLPQTQMKEAIEKLPRHPRLSRSKRIWFRFMAWLRL